MNENKASQIKIAILVIAAILVMILGFNFLKGSSLFSSDSNYSAVFNSAKGLSTSNKVNLLGVDVGQVETVEFIENYSKIKVNFVIDESVKIPEDSKVLIEAGIPGFGSPVLRLQLGQSNSTLPPGSELQSFTSETITDKASKLVENIEPTVNSLNVVLTNLDTLTTSVNKLVSGSNGQNLENAINSLNATMNNLNKTSKKVDDLMGGQTESLQRIIANMSSITSNLANNKDTINQMLSNFNQTSKGLAELEMEKTLASANEAFAELNKTLSKINDGEGSISLLLNEAELYNNLNNAARDLDRLILDLKENPNEFIPDVSVFGKKDKNKEK